MSDLPEIEDDHDHDRETESSKFQSGRAEIALEIVLGLAIELLRNILDEPTIKLPVGADAVSRVWSVFDKHVSAWISRVVYQKAGFIPNQQEISRVQLVLASEAWKNPHSPLEVEDAMTEDPLLEAILLLMSEKRSFEGTCTRLLSELQNTARKHAINQRRSGFPSDCASLGRRLRSLSPILKKANIEFASGRRSGFQRYVTLQLEGDANTSETASCDATASESDGSDTPQSTSDRNNSARADVFRQIAPKGGTANEDSLT